MVMAITLYDRYKIDIVETASDLDQPASFDVKIYTFTGTSGSMEYVDYKSYVYNGYLLKAEGKVIDRRFEYYNTYLVKIHQD